MSLSEYLGSDMPAEANAGASIREYPIAQSDRYKRPGTLRKDFSPRQSNAIMSSIARRVQAHEPHANVKYSPSDSDKERHESLQITHGYFELLVQYAAPIRDEHGKKIAKAEIVATLINNAKDASEQIRFEELDRIVGKEMR